MLKLIVLALALVAAPAAAQEVSTSIDISGIQAQLDAMNSGPVAEFPTVKANAALGAAAAPYARTKWAGSALQTDSTGVRAINVPAGRMTTGLAILGPIVRSAGSYTSSATVVGTPAAGYTVTVTFTKLRPSVTVPAVVLGAAATLLPLVEPQASTGIVTFDIGFAEPDVTGP